MITNITSNTSHYYAFAANPIDITTPATINSDDYNNTFINNWQMIFGKRLSPTDVLPVIKNNLWTYNSIYDRYDNTTDILMNDNFYVISSGGISGGAYHVYKCIDNANGAFSTVDPASIGTPTVATTFKTILDGYSWRYICSISNSRYNRYATNNYVPIYANTSISTTAAGRAGVEVVVIRTGGTGYETYASGNVQSVVNSTVIQIESSASQQNDYYTKNAMYLYNPTSSTSELREIVRYYTSSVGGQKFAVLDTPINTTNIANGTTQYTISPKVVFNTDGTTQPLAYSVVDPIANSISDIVILDKGSNISWANVSIQSNTSYGSGANLYAIAPPSGGHGADPVSELNVKGIGFSFNFSNNETSTIPTANTTYNKIGIIKNPYIMSANGAKGALYGNTTFRQYSIASVVPSYTFDKGDRIVGVSSNSVGTVLFSNSSVVYYTGDSDFTTGEFVSDSRGTSVTAINITSIGNIYTKDLKPLYIQNINNINRSDAQTESFKLIVQL